VENENEDDAAESSFETLYLLMLGFDVSEDVKNRVAILNVARWVNILTNNIERRRGHISRSGERKGEEENLERYCFVNNRIQRGAYHGSFYITIFVCFD
jgi:hypothetical protein